VHELCKMLAQGTGVDTLVLEAAALLHDVGREHERRDPSIDHAEKSAEIAEGILRKVGFPGDKIPQVLYAIRVHRFRRGVTPASVEARILQDADRIDVSGAIGVAMVFAYCGAHGIELYDIDDPFAERRKLDDERYGIDHFFTKLLKLADTMHTERGKEIAKKRREFLRLYLEQFRDELEHRK